MGVVGGGATEIVVQIDHAAGGHAEVAGEGQVLLDAPGAAVGAHAQGVVGIEAVLPYQPGLAVAHALAGIELQDGGVDLARVLLQLGACQPSRVERVLVQCVEHQAELVVGVRVPVQDAVELASRGGAVLAPAVGAKVGETGNAAYATTDAAADQGGLVRAPVTCPGAQAQTGRFGRVAGVRLNHATGGVAVKRGERALDDLHTAQGGQVDDLRLALAVRHGQGNAVQGHVHPLHAEGCVSTKPANGQLHVLGVVLPVVDNEPRDLSQAL